MPDARQYLPPLPRTARLRCGHVIQVTDAVKDVGEFCIFGIFHCEWHTWNIEGNWAYEDMHPLDIVEILPLEQKPVEAKP